MHARGFMPPTAYATVRVSRRLFAAVKLAGMPGYEIAARAGLRAEMLSRLLHGAVPLRPQDRRVLAVARVVGVPARDAFERAEPHGSRPGLEETRRWATRTTRSISAPPRPRG